MYGQQLTWFQRFLQRFQTTPVQMAKAELKDAELAALQCVSMAEYADLRMQTHNLTAVYHESRAERLRKYLENHDRDVHKEGPIASVVKSMFSDKHYPGY